MFLNISDPKATAEQFATIDTAKSKQMLQAESGRVSRDRQAYDTLKNTLTAFQKTLRDLQAQRGMIRCSATPSDEKFATVRESAGLRPGVYHFYVEHLATAGQVVVDVPPGATLHPVRQIYVAVGTGANQHDLVIDPAEAMDKNGVVSAESLARAFNRGAKGEIRAEVVGTKLVLNATKTGKQGKLALNTWLAEDAKKDTNWAFSNALQHARESGVTVEAKNAVFYLGSEKKGTAIEQPSNTLDSIKGLSIEFKQSGKSGSVTIVADNGKTESGVNAFVGAYNALTRSLRHLIRAGDPSKNETGGPFSADAGVRALVSEVTRVLNMPVDGIQFYKAGISIDRYGTMNVDSAQLRKTLETDGAKLNSLFGDKTNGLLGRLGKALDYWTNGTTGSLKRREDTAVMAKRMLDKKYSEWTRRYASLYDRYTREFTRLKIMQANMDQTLSRLKGMFSTGAE